MAKISTSLREFLEVLEADEFHRYHRWNRKKEEII